MEQQISTGDGIVIGALVGLITGMLGAYKDTTFEGFRDQTFWRSPVIASVYGAIGANIFKDNKSKLLLAGFASTAERITVETWKALSGKMPGKFTWGENLDRGWLYKRQAS